MILTKKTEKIKQLRTGGQRALCDRGGGGWVDTRRSWACNT